MALTLDLRVPVMAATDERLSCRAAAVGLALRYRQRFTRSTSAVPPAVLLPGRIRPVKLSITHKWLGGELDAKSDVH